MKFVLWPKRRWTRLICVVCLLLLGPSLYGRLASPWHCIRIRSSNQAASKQVPTSRLRIASYNIAHGRGIATSNWEGGDRAERNDRLDKIAELLRAIDADVVVLNEVDFDSSWSHSVNQAQYLAEQAGYPNWVEQRNLDVRFLGWKWRFGNAVLSRYPIDSAQVIDFPGYSLWETVLGGKKRGIACRIDVGDNNVQVIGAHLSHRSEALRVRSAVMLIDIAAEDQLLHTVVAGDFNSTPPGFPGSVTDADGKNAMEVLEQSNLFQRVTQSSQPKQEELTFHATKPKTIIDWVLIPPQSDFLEYRVETSTLSDHRPIYAEIELLDRSTITEAE